MTKFLLSIILPISVYSQQNLNLNPNKILEDVYFWDQYYRKSKHDCTDFEMQQRDSVNLKIVNNIILNYGFPFDTSLYTQKAFNGIYYTIQHADLNTQIKYLSDIKKMADLGIVHNKKYAMTYDRILVETIGKQKYGEQRYHDTATNCLNYFPFINIDSVQTFRKQLGLDSLDLNKKTQLKTKHTNK